MLRRLRHVFSNAHHYRRYYQYYHVPNWIMPKRLRLWIRPRQPIDCHDWTTTCKWFRVTWQSQRRVNKRIADMIADTKMLSLNQLAAYIILLETLRAIPHLSPLLNEVRHSLFVRAVSKMQIRVPWLLHTTSRSRVEHASKWNSQKDVKRCCTHPDRGKERGMPRTFDSLLRMGA